MRSRSTADRTSSRRDLTSIGVSVSPSATIRHKYLDTVAHTALSVLDALIRGFDIVLICNNANAPFALVPSLTGAKVALNVDGLEWQRDKWSRLGRLVLQALRVALAASCRSSSSPTPESSPDWYAKQYRQATVVHPVRHGSPDVAPRETLERFGRGRALPALCQPPRAREQRRPVLEGYRCAGGLAGLGVPWSIVGDAPYAAEYKRRSEAARRRPRA